MMITLPNILTISRFILTPIFVILFFSVSPYYQLAATLAFITGALTDHYDGKLARRRKQITEFGKFADPLADKFLTITAFIAIWVREDFRDHSILILIYIIVIAVRDFGITFLRMWALSKKAPVITSLWAKIKTTVQLTALIFSMVYFNARDILPLYGFHWEFLRNEVFFPIIHFLILVCMLLTAISGFLYLRASSFEKKAEI